MSNLFYGFLLVFLNFNLTFDSIVINLLPDFLGYYLIMKGLKELTSESDHFMKVIPFAQGMMVYSTIRYILDVVGISSRLGWINVGLSIIVTIFLLYIVYEIIQGILELERKMMTNLNGATLLLEWKIIAVLDIINYLVMFLPLISVLFIFVVAVITILFLVRFHSTKQNYMSARG